MKMIWLINPYGPIPGEGWRDYRFTILGKALTQSGYYVIWWTANFSHQLKKYRLFPNNDIIVNPKFVIKLIPTSSYHSNVSLARMRFEYSFAKNLYTHTSSLEAPDGIISMDPPQPIGYVATKLASKFNVPLILDVFDEWPELFEMAIPKLFKIFTPIIFWPFKALRKRNLSRADGIVSLCDRYLQGIKKIIGNMDIPCAVIFNGIDIKQCRSHLILKPSTIILGSNLVEKSSKDIWVIYAGSLGNTYDILTIMDAAKSLSNYSHIKILIAGDGPLKDQIIKKISKDELKNVQYLGKVDNQELFHLYALCDIGLCAYSKYSNVGMPDKIYDYMAAGLPIINSLKGELQHLIEDNRLGVQYEAGNPVSLSAAIESLMNDGEGRSRMAKNSYSFAERFDQQKQYRNYVEFVNRVMRVEIDNHVELCNLAPYLPITQEDEYQSMINDSPGMSWGAEKHSTK